MALSRGFLSLKGHLAMSGDIFDCQDWGMLLMFSEKPGMEHLTMHSPPTTKNHLAQNVISAEAEILL